MAFEIRKSQDAPYYLQKGKPKKSKDYLAFLHLLPCVVTGTRANIQAAHVSFANIPLGHYGRGKGTKAPDRWALPLCAEEHARQHSMSEETYWRSVGIDPHQLALIIHGLWTDHGDDAVPRAEIAINQALAKAARLRSKEVV